MSESVVRVGTPGEHSPERASNDRWTFLTNHAHVLVCITRDPKSRTRDIADCVGITERAAQRIVADLVEAGYVTRTRIGRRNHYETNLSLPLRHPLETHQDVASLVEVLNHRAEAAAAEEAG